MSKFKNYLIFLFNFLLFILKTTFNFPFYLTFYLYYMEIFLYHELVIRGVLFSFLFYFIVSPRHWRIRPTRRVLRPA